MVQSQPDDSARSTAHPRMRIGAFAAAAGVSVDTVRFYERRGVLPPAPRTTGGYRTFDEHDLDRVNLVRQLQQLGLTVNEVIDALTIHDADGVACSSERWRLEQVARRIDEQMAALRRTKRQIRDALEGCEHGRCQLVSPEPSPTSPPRRPQGQ